MDRETMTVEAYASFIAYGSEDGKHESPIPGDFIHDLEGKIWFSSGGSLCVGCAFCQWHSGADAIYSVGSSTVANVGVDCKTLQNAVDLLETVNTFDSEYDRVERDWLVILSKAALKATPSESMQSVYY